MPERPFWLGVRAHARRTRSSARWVAPPHRPFRRPWAPGPSGAASHHHVPADTAREARYGREEGTRVRASRDRRQAQARAGTTREASQPRLPHRDRGRRRRAAGRCGHSLREEPAAGARPRRDRPRQARRQREGGVLRRHPDQEDGQEPAAHSPTRRPITYPDAPPSFGAAPAAARPRSSASSTPPRTAPRWPTLVHNLEHGYTILWYDDTIAKDLKQKDAIEAISKKTERGALHRRTVDLRRRQGLPGRQAHRPHPLDRRREEPQRRVACNAATGSTAEE